MRNLEKIFEILEKNVCPDKPIDFYFLFSVRNGNPNGDPDANNAPRIDPETSKGFVTDVSLKYKWRRAYEILMDFNPDFPVMYRSGNVLAVIFEEVYNDPELKKITNKTEKALKATELLLNKMADLRFFGGVNASEEITKVRSVQGCMQITFADSIDPINPIHNSIIVCALASKKEAEKREKKNSDNGTFGEKYIINFGLYNGFIRYCPWAGKRNGVTKKDIILFIKVFLYMFEFHCTANSGIQSLHDLFIYFHDHKHGSAPRHEIFNLLKIELKDENAPIVCYENYNIFLDENIPNGIKVFNLLG